MARDEGLAQSGPFSKVIRVNPQLVMGQWQLLEVVYCAQQLCPLRAGHRVSDTLYGSRAAAMRQPGQPVRPLAGLGPSSAASP